jgi:hypothetical protein
VPKWDCTVIVTKTYSHVMVEGDTSEEASDRAASMSEADLLKADPEPEEGGEVELECVEDCEDEV